MMLPVLLMVVFATDNQHACQAALCRVMDFGAMCLSTEPLDGSRFHRADVGLQLLTYCRAYYWG